MKELFIPDIGWTDWGGRGMTKIERLGNRCTNTICHKECPIYYFKENGAGKGTGNNCVESMRFPNVARNVELWLKGKPWSRTELGRWEDE